MTRKKKGPAPGVTLLGDGRYEVLATARTSTGRRYAQETMPVGSTLGQAIDRRAKLAAQLRAGGPDRRADLPTFEVFSKAWIARMAREGYARGTVEHNAYKLSWGLPALGRLRVDLVTLAALERARDEIEAASTISHRTGSEVWATIRQVVRRAWVEHDCAPPVDLFNVIRPPRCRGGRSTDKRALTAQEVAAILDKAEANVEQGNPGAGRQRRLEAEVILAGGFRAGEILSLTWDCFDAERGTISIRPTVEKTRRGREVALPRRIVAELVSWRREMIAAQHIGLGSGLVFPSPVTGRRRCGDGLRMALKNAARGVGVEVDVHVHTLRRTANRLAMEAGVERSDLRAQLGHTSAAMTDLYRGVRLTDKRAVAEAGSAGWLDLVVGPGEGEGGSTP